MQRCGYSYISQISEDAAPIEVGVATRCDHFHVFHISWMTLDSPQLAKTSNFSGDFGASESGLPLRGVQQLFRTVSLLVLFARKARRIILFFTTRVNLRKSQHDGQHPCCIFFHLHCFLLLVHLRRQQAISRREEPILGFTLYGKKHHPSPHASIMSTAIAATAFSMPSVSQVLHPLSISLDFFDIDEMSAEHHSPFSSASSSSSDHEKRSPAGKLKKRCSTGKILSSKRLSNEEKQAKNRLFVKRCYYKKREALKNLRDEVAQLEGEFASVLQRWQKRNENSAKAFCDGKRHITPQDLYAELTVARSSLIEEQQRLNVRLADRQLFRQRLQQLYEPTH